MNFRHHDKNPEKQWSKESLNSSHKERYIMYRKTNIKKKKKAHFPLEKMLVRRQCNKLLADLKTLKFQLRRLYLEK